MNVFRKATKRSDHDRWEEASASATLDGEGMNLNSMLAVPTVARALNGKWRSEEDVDTLLVMADDVASSLTAYHGTSWKDVDDYNIVAYALRSNGSNSRAAAHEAEVANALLSAGAKAGGGTSEETVVLSIRGVRRLSPTECERLQGLPDGWTVPWGSSLLDVPAWHEHATFNVESRCPWDPPARLDTPRRSACGDAVNAAVSEWIGRRLMEVGSE